MNQEKISAMVIAFLSVAIIAVIIFYYINNDNSNTLPEEVNEELFLLKGLDKPPYKAGTEAGPMSRNRTS